MASNASFMELSGLFDDAAEHLPENLYINMYNKLKECKDRTQPTQDRFEQAVYVFELKERCAILESDVEEYIERENLMKNTIKNLKEKVNCMSLSINSYRRELSRRNVNITITEVRNERGISQEYTLEPDNELVVGETIRADWKMNGFYSGKYFNGKILGVKGDPIVPDRWPMDFIQGMSYTIKFDDGEIQHGIQREYIKKIVNPLIFIKPEKITVGTITNPQTDRQIKVGGRKYKQLKKDKII